MSKHTPGPWRVASDQNSVGDTVWAGDLPVAICSPVRVFLASRQTVQTTGAEASANARLIAAAPELLEALKRMATIIDKMGDMPDGFIHPSPWQTLKCEEALTQARAAIKAVEEGK